jgi:pimeloyl-ACP methyl ester carboxylesterase
MRTARMPRYVSSALLALSLAGSAQAFNRAILVLCASSAAAASLPAVAGPHAVGRATYVLLDQSRHDVANPRSPRAIQIHVWYPAQPNTGEATTYVPADLAAAMTKDGYSIPPEASSTWDKIPVAARENAKPTKVTKLGVILLSPGLGMSIYNYSILAQDLASHGYVVIGIEHPYGGYALLPSGKVLSTDKSDIDFEKDASITTAAHQWAQDDSFVLDCLSRPTTCEPRLAPLAAITDPMRATAIGHSLGGAAALQACASDPRVVACIDMDGEAGSDIIASGVPKTTLFLRSNPDYTPEELAKKTSEWHKRAEAGDKEFHQFLRAGAKPLFLVRLRGTAHVSFSDYPYVMPEAVSHFGGRLMSPSRAEQVMLICVLAFVREFQQSGPAGSFAKSVKRIPEAEVQTFRWPGI